MTTIESEWQSYWNRRATPKGIPPQMQGLLMSVSQLAFYAGALGFINCLLDAHTNKENGAIERLHAEVLHYVMEVALKS